MRRPVRVGGALALAALLAVAVLLALAWTGGTSAPEATATPPVAALGRAEGFSLMAAGGGAGPVAGSATPTARAPDDVAHALYVEGSLRGSSPDGDWGVDAHGQLRPTLALRRRFDHYLSAIGEASVAELRSLVQAQAVRDVGAAAAGDILAVWDRYLALQHHRWATTADPSDALSVQRALSERRQVRREHLGPAWADAFYAAEEAQLRADLAAAGTAVPRPESDPLRAPPALADAQARALLHQQRVVQYGEDAARRLADLDAAEADWQRRLSQARGEIARIQQSPELSQPQRQQAIERHLTEAFTATEQRRARALLELTPSASTAAR